MNFSEVITPDGPGKVLGMEMRKNTNGGPGCRQYRVQLMDGHIRHYSQSKLTIPGSITMKS